LTHHIRKRPKNVLTALKQNIPSHQLVHIPHGQQNIPLKDVEDFLVERFDKCKKGTDFRNLRTKFGIGKSRAQRILKRGKKKRLFFSPVRKNPQEYFPESRRFQVVEYINKSNNVPKDTTGTSHFNSPLSYAIEQQKAANFLETLLFARNISRQINKIELEAVTDKKKMLDKDYYYHMNSPKELPQNKGKAVEEFIDERKIKFIHYRNCKVMISISCSEKPFPIETEEDILNLFSFFGQIRDRLGYQISDPRGRIVGPIASWILKQCEINKDIPITDEAQLTLPDIQLSTANRVFRLYVKNLGGQAHYRIEELLQVNQPLQILDSMLNVNQGVEKRIDELNRKIDSLINLINKNQNNSQNQDDYKPKTKSATLAMSVSADQESTSDNVAAPMGALVNWYHHNP
jgi:hypothetical protein